MRNTVFRYKNVQYKMLANSKNKYRNYLNCNNDRVFNPCVSYLMIKNYSNFYVGFGGLGVSTREQLDVVNPLSSKKNIGSLYKRSSIYKTKLNTYNQYLNSKVSNAYKEDPLFSKIVNLNKYDVQINDVTKFGRSITLPEYPLITQSLRKSTYKKQRGGSMFNSVGYYRSKYKQPQEPKKYLIKIKGTDTSSILKLITESKVYSSMLAIKAYKNSVENCQKYFQIYKNKIYGYKYYVFKTQMENNTKFDYGRSIYYMKNYSKWLSSKKSYKYYKSKSLLSASNQLQTKGQYSSSKPFSVSQQKYKSSFSVQGTLLGDSSGISSPAFQPLYKKALQIQSISFCDNYLLVSLLNCYIRLYSFKRTIHGFIEYLIFEKAFQGIVTNVQIYKSQVRKHYNICVVLSKNSLYSISSNTQKNYSQAMAVNVSASSQKPYTDIWVYPLSPQMQPLAPTFNTQLNYSPIVVGLLPLGLGGFCYSGQFFIVYLNCKTKTRSYIKTIDTILFDYYNGSKCSISCMRCHRDQVTLYLGCKDGSIYIYDLLGCVIRNKRKISNHSILNMGFSGGGELLYWDNSGKIGTINAYTLLESKIYGVGTVGYDRISGNSQYFAITEYFIENHFLIYGEKSIGLISLFENQYKKFHIEKPLKMFTRRQALKNKHFPSPTPKSVSKKALWSIFNLSHSLILITGDGYILVHDKNLIYIGSFFTLNFNTIVQCISCSALKHLYLLHQNNEMQVINIYTQEELITTEPGKYYILQIFFCNSAVYFCGYVTGRTYDVVVYGHTEQGNKYYTTPMLRVGLIGLIKDIQQQQIYKTQYKQEKQYKQQNWISDNAADQSRIKYFGKIPYMNNIDIEFHFYKGSMIIVDISKSIVLFLYKKSFTRNCMIRCSDYFYSYNSASVVQSSILLDVNVMTLLMSNSNVVVLNLYHKTLQAVYKLPQPKLEMLNTYNGNILSKKEYKQLKGVPSYQYDKPKFEAIYHFYNPNHSSLTIIWKITVFEPMSTKSKIYFGYVLYEISDKISGTEIGDVTQKKFFIAKNAYQFKSNSQKYISSRYIVTNWASQPFLIGENMVAMNYQQSYIDVYSMKKNKIQMKYNDVLKSKESYENLEKYKLNSTYTKNNFLEYEHYKIQPY